MTDTRIDSKESDKQKRLLNRYWVAAGSSVLVLLLITGLYSLGHLVETGYYITSIGILSAIILFFVLFHTKLNLKANDPSLTIPQLLTATIVITIGMYYTSIDARTVWQPIVLMAFVFGVFRLNTRKLVLLTLFIIACQASMIYLLLRFRPDYVDLQLELLHLLVFAPVLLWFSVMGGYIGKLRKSLSDSKAAMEVLATHDALTGVYNRRHLLNALRQEKLRSDRSDLGFCIGLIDLDRFKALNDKYGHQAGDDVLKACAERAAEKVRQTDCFGRYGGEEFQVLLMQTDLKGAHKAAEIIRKAVSNLQFAHIDPHLKVTVSIGLAEYRPKEDIEETEKRADLALYRAKAAGRNRVEIEPKNVGNT